MKLWVPLEELRDAANLAQLTVNSIKDEELIKFCGVAQSYAEKHCSRSFDGEKSSIEYFDGDNESSSLMLRNFPINSISEINDDLGFSWGSSTALSASDYFTVNSIGQIYLKSKRFGRGKKNIRVTYKGGYISEKSVVAAALAANTMTIANDLSAYSQPFSLFIQTATAQTAGSVSITGSDENGDAQSETLTFNGTSAQRINSRKLWTKITVFSALNIRGAASTGTVQVTATSFPEDLRAAIQMFAAYLYRTDQDQSLNISSRTIEGETESEATPEVPKEILQILNGYKDYL